MEDNHPGVVIQRLKRELAESRKEAHNSYERMLDLRTQLRTARVEGLREAAKIMRGCPDVDLLWDLIINAEQASAGAEGEASASSEPSRS